MMMEHGSNQDAGLGGDTGKEQLTPPAATAAEPKRGEPPAAPAIAPATGPMATPQTDVAGSVLPTAGTVVNLSVDAASADAASDDAASDDAAAGAPPGNCCADTAGEAHVRGVVKWFDAIKGYGFVTVDDGLGDILIHYKLLAPHQRKSLPDGTGVTLRVRAGPRGRQGTEILSLDLAAAASPAPRRPCAAAEGVAADGYETVQVRWFNRTKGYGFLLRNDGTTEVFIHMETVRRGGFGTLAAGQQLLAAIKEGPRGAHAIAIRAPDAAGD